MAFRYSQVNALKSTNPNLKTLLAMGGWSATSGPYSNMASSASTRSVFINSLIAWLRQHNFDGVDMDWEFPAYALRGGVPADYTNFALLIKVCNARLIKVCIARLIKVYIHHLLNNIKHNLRCVSRVHNNHFYKT